MDLWREGKWSQRKKPTLQELVIKKNIRKYVRKIFKNWQIEETVITYNLSRIKILVNNWIWFHGADQNECILRCSYDSGVGNN